MPIYVEFLGPKAERYHSLLLIISWSERLLQYAIFFGPSVRSFWGILSQNLMKNGQDRAKIRSQIFFCSNSSKFTFSWVAWQLENVSITLRMEGHWVWLILCIRPYLDRYQNSIRVFFSVIYNNQEELQYVFVNWTY